MKFREFLNESKVLNKIKKLKEEEVLKDVEIISFPEAEKLGWKKTARGDLKKGRETVDGFVAMAVMPNGGGKLDIIKYEGEIWALDYTNSIHSIPTELIK